MVVESDATLQELHRVIQAAFGWMGGHLHEFDVAGRRYGPADDEKSDADDEASVTLSELASEGRRFVYTYDFGDDWRHRIEVEAIDAASGATTYPTCVDGRRAGPPEDCGGPSGYADLLAAIGDPSHPDHDEQLEWLGPGFDPEEFEPADFAEAYESGPPLADFF